MLKNKRILLTILMVSLLLFIPNIVKAESLITSIGITVPYPILGEKPASKEQITVNADINNVSQKLEIEDVGWEFYDENNEQGLGANSLKSTDVFQNDKNYKVHVIYGVPVNYVLSNNPRILVNGNKIDIEKIDNYSQVSGNPEQIYYMVTYHFGKAKAKINFNMEDVVVIDTEIGEVSATLPGRTIRLLGTVEKADGAKDWNVTVKGKSGTNIEVKKLDDDEGLPYYEFIMPGETVYITTEYIFEEVEETTPEVKAEVKAEKTEESKDESKAPGTIPHAGGTFIIIVSSLLLLAGGFYAIKKNNDLKGI